MFLTEKKEKVSFMTNFDSFLQKCVLLVTIFFKYIFYQNFSAQTVSELRKVSVNMMDTILTYRKFCV